MIKIAYYFNKICFILLLLVTFILGQKYIKLKMVKKMNELAVTIKKLLEQGFSQTWIARKLNIRRQKVNYWAKNPIKSEQKRRRKLGDKYIKEIISLAENKTTSSKSSNKISNIINKKLKEDGTNLSITKMTVCRILNKELGKPMKIKRVFYLSKKNKMKRVEFCKKMIEKNISGKKIYYLLMKLLLIWVVIILMILSGFPMTIKKN